MPTRRLRPLTVRPHGSALRDLELADRRRRVARDRGWTHSLVTVAGGDVYWSEARPLEDGRDAIVVRRAGARARRRDPAPSSQRPHARARVRRRRVHRRRRHRVLLQRRRPADLPRRPGARAAADHARAGRAVRAALRRPARSPATGSSACASATASRSTSTTRGVPYRRPAEPRVIASGHDFYAAPRISPDGSAVAWLTWDHPRMPWEGSELWVARVRRRRAHRRAARRRRRRRRRSSSPSGARTACCTSAPTAPAGGTSTAATTSRVTALEAEIGGPLWVFGESWYAFLRRRPDRLHRLQRRQRPARGGRAPRRAALRAARVHADRRPDDRRRARALRRRLPHARGRASSPPTSTTGAIELLAGTARRSSTPRYVSVPRPLEYPTTGGKTAHALFYPPHNPDYTAPEGERPPLMVRVHGGPTAHVTARSRAEIQFFTSRGFAVVDVNYGGSTGYGREYRDRLRGQWGVVDVDDAVNAARALADGGRGRRRADDDHRRQRRRLDRAVRARLPPRRVRRRRRLLRRLRPRRASSTTRTSSSRATTTGSSARGPRPRSCGASARRSTTPTASARR